MLITTDKNLIEQNSNFLIPPIESQKKFFDFSLKFYRFKIIQEIKFEIIKKQLK